MHKEWGCFKK